MSLQLRIKKGNDNRSVSYSPQARSGDDIGTKVTRVKSMYEESRKKMMPRRRTEPSGVLDEIIICGICKNRLQDPKMLKCQHTFCLSCLQNHLIANSTSEEPTFEDINDVLKKSSISLKCVTCEEAMIITDGFDGLEQLPNNIYIDSFLKLLDGNVEETQMIGKPTTDLKCVNCSTVCKFDEQKNCEHCKLIFCMVCFPAHVEDLSRISADFFKQLSDSEDKLKYKSEDYERKCAKLKDEIRMATEQKINDMKNMETVAMAEINSLLEGNNESLSKIHEIINAFKSDIQLSVTNKLGGSSGDEDKVKNYMLNHKKMSNLMKLVSRFGELTKVFNADLYKLEDVAAAQEDVLPDIYVESPADARKSLKAHYQNRQFVTKLIWSKCPRLAGMAVSPWESNLIYVAATDSRSVLILNKATHKIIGRLTHSDMLYPQDIDFCKTRREIFISDKWKMCIHIFSENNDYLRSICSRGCGRGQITSPQGIASYNPDNLLVCDSGNDRILILDPVSGEQKGMIGVQGNITELKFPTDIAVYEDKIIIADAGNNKIKIFNINGEKIKQFGSIGSDRGQFKCGEVVGVDPLGFIFVGDSENERVQIFNSEGSYVKSFTFAGIPTFTSISGLCITSDLNIVVTDSKNKHLVIF